MSDVMDAVIDVVLETDPEIQVEFSNPTYRGAPGPRGEPGPAG